MSGSLQSDMMHVLQDRICGTPELASRLFAVGTVFTQKLTEMYKRRESSDYQYSKSCEWLRNIGDMVVGGRVLLTSAHLGDHNGQPHWVGVVINAGNGLIRYGNSLKDNPIPSTLLETYCWWLSHHTNRTFSEVDLPISNQVDGFSCGFLCDNALNHFVDPESYPLLKPADLVPM